MAGSFLIHFINGRFRFGALFEDTRILLKNANDGDGFLGKGIDALCSFAISVGFTWFHFLLGGYIKDVS